MAPRHPERTVNLDASDVQGLVMQTESIASCSEHTHEAVSHREGLCMCATKLTCTSAAGHTTRQRRSSHNPRSTTYPLESAICSTRVQVSPPPPPVAAVYSPNRRPPEATPVEIDSTWVIALQSPDLRSTNGAAAGALQFAVHASRNSGSPPAAPVPVPSLCLTQST